MNFKDFQLYYEDKTRPIRWNTVLLGKAESVNHQLAKLKVVEGLVKRELPFGTEVNLVGFGRVDVVSPLSDEIFECLESETEIKFEQKCFPKGFKVFKVVYDSENDCVKGVETK